MSSIDPPQLAEWRARGTHFDFRGHPIFYRRSGRGRTVLLVHGFPTASYDWYAVWPSLARRFDVIAPDLLGFGFSDKPRDHRYTIAEQADLLVALLEHTGASSFDLLCHDYGVTVGQELLARREEGLLPGLRSICLLNGGLFPETHRARPIQRLLASPLGPFLASRMTERTLGRSMRSVFGPETPPSDEDVRAFYALVEHGDGKHAIPRLLSYMAERRRHRERWVGALVNTRVPMRVVNGVLDPVSGAHMLDRLEELRPGTDVVRLPVGHYPQVEAPKDVLAAILRFYASVMPR